MYAAFKYAKRKYHEHQERQIESTSDGVPHSGPTVMASTLQPPEQESEVKNKTKKPERSPEEIAETKRRRRYRWKIILGLWAPFALSSLDVTIIASAMPFIAADFGELKQLNWIISAFNLTSAAFLFFWAQLTDIFGRHVTLQTSIIVMIIGSAICTGAPRSTFGVLLLGRALQGVGAAGVDISVRVILADRVSLSDYAKNWTIFSLVAGVSFSIGPVVGGYLTKASWRWCFGINLPVAVVAIVLVVLTLRSELLGPQPLPELEKRDTSTRQGRLASRLSTLDYGGQSLFLWGMGLLSLALTWAGGSYAWNSATVLAPLLIGAVLSVGWILYEYSMSPQHFLSRVFPRQRPMMPWKLLSQRDVGILFLTNMALGMAMFAVMYFMDLYFALVEGRSSSDAGIALLFYLPGLAVGIYMAMFASNIWPRQTTPVLLFGGITTAVGISVLPWAIHQENTSLIYGMMALVGHGVAIRFNPGSLHGLAYFPTMTAQITCLLSFAQPFGGLVGLTIMSTVFTNKSGADASEAKEGIMWAFIAMVPFMWLCVILITFLGNTWISKDGSHEVVHGAWLWSLVARRELTKERKTRGDDLGRLPQTEEDKSPQEDLELASLNNAPISTADGPSA